MIYFLLALFVLMWSIFIFHVIKDKRLEGFYFKGLTSFLFICIFGFGVFKFSYEPYNIAQILIFETRYIYLLLFVMLGLVSGLIGDLFLEVQWFYKVRRNYMIKQGMVIFLIGHVFYILGMHVFTGFNSVSLIIGLMMTVIVYLGSRLMKIDFQNLKIMTYIYTFVIFTMVGSSIFQAIELSFNLYSILFMTGAILFGISDLLLAPIYFKDETKHVFVVGNLATYYLGQCLIALAFAFL